MLYCFAKIIRYSTTSLLCPHSNDSKIVMHKLFYAFQVKTAWTSHVLSSELT